MVSQVLPIVGNLITSCVDLVFSIFNRLGAFSLVFGAFIVWTIHRFLLRPIIGGVGSDIVKGIKSSGSSKSSSNKSSKGDES